MEKNATRFDYLNSFISSSHSRKAFRKVISLNPRRGTLRHDICAAAAENGTTAIKLTKILSRGQLSKKKKKKKTNAHSPISEIGAEFAKVTETNRMPSLVSTIPNIGDDRLRQLSTAEAPLLETAHVVSNNNSFSSQETDDSGTLARLSGGTTSVNNTSNKEGWKGSEVAPRSSSVESISGNSSYTKHSSYDIKEGNSTSNSSAKQKVAPAVPPRGFKKQKPREAPVPLPSLIPIQPETNVLLESRTNFPSVPGANISIPPETNVSLDSRTNVSVKPGTNVSSEPRTNVTLE